jgi:hypothetical protein
VSTAELVTVIAACGAALVSVIGAVFGGLAMLKSRANGGAISAVHVLVNNRLSEVTERAEQLADALRRAGVDVPKPSLPKPGPGDVPGGRV